MPQLMLSEEVYDRITQFKQVVEAVLEEPIDFDTYVELLLSRATDCMLADLLGAVDSDTLLASFQQLASKHPASVYGYVAETLKRGQEVIDQKTRAAMKRKIGFLTPGNK
ncbi:MAG: hypothetical protein L6435_12925 [Anaerolineae bacterium]|nr:hypothetical protein [Anaerolineae bacterium]